MLDFAEAGQIGVFIDPQSVAAREARSATAESCRAPNSRSCFPRCARTTWCGRTS
jgi:hypothetical protein